MDDLMYRNCSIAESNLGPNRRPASNKFKTWSSYMAGQIAGKPKSRQSMSDITRANRLLRMEEVVKERLDR